MEITSEGQQVAAVDGNALLSSEPATTTESTSSTESGTLLGEQKAETTTTTGSDSSWVNDKGEFAEGWLDRLPSELADSKQILGQFKDINGALKTLVNQQKMLGKKAEAVLIPDDKATPEERAAFFKRLGVPDTAEAYQLRPKGLPEGAEWDESAAKSINEIAHANGVTPKAMDAIMAKYAEFEAGKAQQSAQQQAKELEAGRKQLAEAWGDKFDIELSVARRAAQVAGVDVNSKGFNDPNVVIAFNRLARMMSDDKIVNSDSPATMMAGKARAMDIMRNPQNPLHVRYTQGDKEIATLVTDLLKNG